MGQPREVRIMNAERVRRISYTAFACFLGLAASVTMRVTTLEHEVAVGWDTLPEPVRVVLEWARPGERPHEVTQESSGATVVYEAEYESGGVEIEVDANGNILDPSQSGEREQDDAEEN